LIFINASFVWVIPIIFGARRLLRARKIGEKGIRPKPEVFNLMRNKIYIELRNRIMAISGV
jgi:hypothetical protein